MEFPEIDSIRSSCIIFFHKHNRQNFFFQNHYVTDILNSYWILYPNVKFTLNDSSGGERGARP